MARSLFEGLALLGRAACLSLLLAASAQAAARTIADCESLKDADEYNRCLASFGPARGARGAATNPSTLASRGVIKATGGRLRHYAGGARRGILITPQRNGRVRTIITLGGR